MYIYIYVCIRIYEYMYICTYIYTIFVQTCRVLWTCALTYTATHCNTLPLTSCSSPVLLIFELTYTATHCSALQHTATRLFLLTSLFDN